MREDRYGWQFSNMPVFVRGAAGVVILAVVVAIVISLFAKSGDTSAYQPSDTTSTPTATSSVDATTSAESTDAVIPEGEPYVMVIADGLKLREEPSLDARVIKQLKSGQKLEWLETGNGWYHVKDASGSEGWVAAGGQYTERVTP